MSKTRTKLELSADGLTVRLCSVCGAPIDYARGYAYTCSEACECKRRGIDPYNIDADKLSISDIALVAWFHGVSYGMLPYKHPEIFRASSSYRLEAPA